MPKDSLTFELGGYVDIEQLENGIKAFHRLVKALTPRNSGVSWKVDELNAGSAIAIIVGESEDTSVVEKIVNNYENVGALLQQGGSLADCGRLVSNAAEAIKSITETTEYVRMATSDGEFFLSKEKEIGESSARLSSIGAVTGRIQSMSIRGNLRFNLYDSIFDRAVVCYLSPGQEDQMIEVWGKQAKVFGHVYREPKGYRPISIRRILNIEVMPDIEAGIFRQARGAVPWHPDGEGGEEVIRRLRDA